ncbi:hypothetical protein D3C72_1745440 [compost metagenome]
MAMFAQGDHGPHEGQPYKQPAREFLGDGDAGIERVAQHHIAKDQHHHDGEAQACQDIQRAGVCPQHAVGQCKHVVSVLVVDAPEIILYELVSI